MKKYYSKSYTWQTSFSMLTLLIGFLLLFYMITVEDEPGGIPMLLIFVGAGWFARTLNRKRKQIVS